MADLLEKFGNVKVDVTSKISESDKAACLIMQEAYDKACESLKQLRTMGKMHIAGQKRVTESLPSGVISDYLGDVCNINKINYRLQDIHAIFIVICKSKFQLGVEFSLTNLSIIHYGN